jgi:hypothetical protein
MLEHSVEARLVKGVTRLGGKAFKFVVPGVRGIPDRICFLPMGRLFLIECKRPKGGRLSPMQVRMHGWFCRMGFPVLLISTIAEVDEFLAAVEAK